MTSHPSRHYSDKEFSLILRRATELQRAAPSSANPTGLTLADLEDIAHGGLVGGGGAGTASMLGPLTAAVTGSAILTGGVIVVTLGAVYSLARGIFARKSASRRRTLDALMFAIVERVEQSVTKLPPEGTIR